ncbi:MAG TPA: hypothetical protein VN698_10445 [Bacteroidia bacterium]|nr:hypothetical protein [Bacteroidia bacterium]
MSTTVTKKTILMAAVSAMFIFSACHNGGKKDEGGYNATTPTSTCSCETKWFPHPSTPNTIDGVGGPFDTSSTTNCQFHQWSWQKFLWLTRPMQSGHAFFQDSLMQVNADLSSVNPYNNIPLVLQDTAQAGSGGSVRTNATFSTDGQNHLVYYSIFVDKKLRDAAIAFKAMIVKDPSKLDNDSTFPNGSLELKISWVNVAAIPVAEQAAYYTTDAVIKTIVKKDTIYTPTKVALLGMHVVGRVINHPEFIWATFEHHHMAAFYNWANATATSDAAITSTNNKLLFRQGTTTTLAGITWPNNGTAPDSMYRIFTLYKYGTPRLALDSFMTGTCQAGSVNYANIDSLNKCVAANLAPTDVWRNYFYNGSIWVNMDGTTPAQQAALLISRGSNIGSALTDSVVRGSLAVFNLTMETYLQTFTSNTNQIHTFTADSIANCFGCHTSAPFSLKFEGASYKNKRSPLYVSHIFRDYVSATEKSTLSDAKLQGVKDFLLTRKSIQEKALLRKKK